MYVLCFDDTSPFELGVLPVEKQDINPINNTCFFLICTQCLSQPRPDQSRLQHSPVPYPLQHVVRSICLLLAVHGEGSIRETNSGQPQHPCCWMQSQPPRPIPSTLGLVHQLLHSHLSARLGAAIFATPSDQWVDSLLYLL